MNDDKLYISSINCNMAHTCGNVCAVITDYYIKKFPKDFIKKTHKTTDIAVRQFKKINDLTDFKWKKPYLIVQPKLLIGDPTEAHIDVQRRLYGTSMYDITRIDDVTAKFFYDEMRNIILDYAVERTRMSFQFTLVVNTEGQQYNVSAHMVNSFRLGHAFYLPTKLETILPDLILRKISDDSGIPILDDNKSPTRFLNYLNSVSRIPITLELDPATGYYRFRLVVQTNILMMFEPSLDVGEGSGDGKVIDSFPLVINCNMEFNYPSRFFYISDKEKTSIDNTEQEPFDTLDNFELSTQNTFFYTLQKIIIPEQDTTGKLLDKSIGFITEDENLDTVEFKPIMEQYYFDIIQELKNNDIDYSVFVNIVVYENEMIKDSTDYDIDLDNCVLTIRNTDTTKTYRIIVYLDNNMVNKYKLSGYKYQ